VSKSAILGIGTTILLIGLIAISMRGVRQVQCEVCITFKGETACRVGEGRTREDAQRTAAESCCAVLPASGMAERIQCSKSEPTSLSCD
jgi:hypothetical protein